MMRTTIEALYIYDQQNDPILEHIYRSRPASAATVLPLYLAHQAPRPSLIYLQNINPPTLLFSLVHSGLLFLSPASSDTEPLFVLEFLHRVVDVLEEFLGAPLLASKIEGAYDVVAQLLGQICDAGSVCNTEPNALRDVVDIPGWMGKLLGGVSLPGSSPALNPPTSLKHQLALNNSNTGPAIPWRRANVRHTSNELYVDIVETLSITLAPSGLPLAAFAHGTVAFTSKISGVPDLLLTLSTPGGKAAIERALELPVFHPCVRLARWRERPGELSFVPPDGKFVLAGYEVNLLPSGPDFDLRSPSNLHLPVTIEVAKSLGPTGSDFEARLHLSNTFAGSSSTSSTSSRPGLGSRGSIPAFGSSSGSSSAALLADVVVTIPIPAAVRNITDLRASRGEAHFSPADNAVEWRLPTKDAAAAGSATLRCTVIGPLSDEDEDAATNGFRFDAASGEYDDAREEAYQSSSAHAEPVGAGKSGSAREAHDQRDQRRIAQNAPLMPSSASVSFSVKGWLASGVRVEGLVVDARKSRGLGEGVRPYKGVKYLTVSRGGLETRC